MAVVSEKHRLSRNRTIEVEELADEPLLRGRPRVLFESGGPLDTNVLGTLLSNISSTIRP